MITIDVYTDGSFGESDGIGGVGIVGYRKGRVIGTWGKSYFDIERSSDMEIYALLHGLEVSIEEGFKRVNIYNDLVSKNMLESNGYSQEFINLASNFKSNSLNLIKLDKSRKNNGQKVHWKRHRKADREAGRQRIQGRKIASEINAKKVS